MSHNLDEVQKLNITVEFNISELIARPNDVIEFLIDDTGEIITERINALLQEIKEENN